MSYPVIWANSHVCIIYDNATEHIGYVSYWEVSVKTNLMKEWICESGLFSLSVLFWAYLRQ